MDGKVIAITGGASGIGLATSKILLSRGATVCIGDIDLSQAKECFFSKLYEGLKYPLLSIVDVSSPSEVDAWISSIVEKYGRLDGAANCAGVIGKHHGIKEVAETEDEEWDGIMAVNLTGLFYSLRAELKVIEDGGSIVNVASIQGLMGFAKHGAYVASKHGVIGLTRVAAKEVGERNIRINAIAPGAIETPMLAKADVIMNVEKHDEPSAIKRLGTAEEMGFLIAFLLGPESTFTTGAVYGADGGWAC